MHPQLDIRQRAVRYFDDCYSEDEGVVPLVIQAVEKYGRENAYQLVGGSVHLRHTEETIAWVIEELQNPAAERYENYVFNLNRILCDADLALLLPRESEILETCRFYGGLKDHLIRRLELISWDEAEEQETIPPTPDLASVDEILADSRTDAGVNRVGRNDPCPCGSGKKYKKCCMRKQQN